MLAVKSYRLSSVRRNRSNPRCRVYLTLFLGLPLYNRSVKLVGNVPALGGRMKCMQLPSVSNIGTEYSCFKV